MKSRLQFMMIMLLTVIIPMALVVNATEMIDYVSVGTVDNGDTVVYLPFVQRNDDSKILFFRGSMPVSNQFADDVYVINNDGSDSQNLTMQLNTNDYDPSWSPDRSQITFVSLRDGVPEIYVMNADGSNQTRLTNNSMIKRFPTWSPNGNRIFFMGDGSIYFMNADGSGISNTGLSGSYPNLSPNGVDLLFSSNGDIYTAGATVVNLTNNSAQGNSDPEYSPDGSKIAFVSTRNGENRIYVMDSDGTNQTRLTNDFGRDPTWSPTGDKIAFVCSNLQICVMNADGSNVVDITQHPKWSVFPDW